VSHCGLAIYIKKYPKAKAKEEIWKLKCFTTLLFFLGEFWQSGDKKERLANPTKEFLRLKRNRHILTKKLRSRQI